MTKQTTDSVSMVRQGSRREFVRTCGRCSLLAGIAVLGGLLALRKPGAGGVEACLKRRPCHGCNLFADCAKPEAVSARKGQS